jgi:hypothetical protein
VAPAAGRSPTEFLDDIMGQADWIKVFVAAIAGAVLKELFAWMLSFSKTAVFGPMWKHSQKIFTDFLACVVFAAVLVRFGIDETPATRLDILILVGCALGLLACSIMLLVSIVQWQAARAATVDLTAPS